MGMDVYGTKPDSRVGEYFRNSVWSWHPLWSYCCHVAPDICASVEYGHSNDGDGLLKRASLALAKVLRANIESGAAAEYAMNRQSELDAMPDLPCEICAGTGKRAEPPTVGAGDRPCNGCEAKGKVRPFETHYHFDVENVSEFADFLEHCGGFEIN